MKLLDLFLGGGTRLQCLFGSEAYSPESATVALVLESRIKHGFRQPASLKVDRGCFSPEQKGIA